MATPESPLPPAMMAGELAKLVTATQMNAAASIAAAMIAATGRPHSIEEALGVLRDVQYSLFPSNGHGHFENWKKSFDAKKIHS